MIDGNERKNNFVDDWPEEDRAWYDSRPDIIQQTIVEFNPTKCWRLKNTNGHYHLNSFIEPEKLDDPVGVTVYHLPDSFMPGVGVVGLTTDDLVVCGCMDN